MNDNIDLNWLWATLTAAGSSFVTWIFTRKKQNAEVKTNELDNVEKAVEIWREMAADLRGQFEALQNKFLQLQEQVIELKLENTQLKAKNKELEEEIVELRKSITP